MGQKGTLIDDLHLSPPVLPLPKRYTISRLVVSKKESPIEEAFLSRGG
jgi:hypothetical protein